MNLAAALTARWVRMPGWLRALPPCACAALIWFLSAQQGARAVVPWWHSVAHNAAHVVAYGVLGGLVWLALAGPRLGWRAWIAVALAGAYGAVDEWHQAFVPGRAASAGDVVSDLAGACLSVGLACGWVHGERSGFGLAGVAALVACGSVAFESFA